MSEVTSKVRNNGLMRLFKSKRNLNSEINNSNNSNNSNISNNSESSNDDSSQSAAGEERDRVPDVDLDRDGLPIQYTKDGRRKGSRRRCIDPDVRRKMGTSRRRSLGTSVNSAPYAIDTDGPRNVGSIKSAPTASITFSRRSVSHGPSHDYGQSYDNSSFVEDRSRPPITDLGNIQRYRGNRSAKAEKLRPTDEERPSYFGGEPPMEHARGGGGGEEEEPIVRRYSSFQQYQQYQQFRDENNNGHSGGGGGGGAMRRGGVGNGIVDGTKSVGARTCQSMDSQMLLQRRKSETLKSNVKIPRGEITIVVTDVEGSTKLWEDDPVAMEEALDLHDSIIRKCYTNQNGYEIMTEGDSFVLAFHHPLDAFSFALQAQLDLYNAKWSERILEHKNAKLDKINTMRGLRVRMGLHHGETQSFMHEITGRTYYKGDPVNVANAVEAICHGGQIITTYETWRAVSGMAERYLGSPQVLDCGEHELDDEFQSQSLKTTKLVQLVPKKFAFDYFTWRGAKEKNYLIRKEGRRFPPLKTKRLISAGFNGAPYKNNEVVMVFVYTTEVIDDLNEESKGKNLALLANLIRTNLSLCRPRGYECQEANGQWMLAFHTLNSAITFGVKTTERLNGAPLNVKIGIQKGLFTSQGPHKVTGRADYFGQIVNRTARVASSCEPGQVLLGVPDDEAVQDFELPSSKMFGLTYLRTEKFKGMSVTSSLYDCFLQIS